MRRTALAVGACLLVGVGVLAVTNSDDDTPAADAAQTSEPPPVPVADPDPEPEPDPVADPEPDTEPAPAFNYSFTAKGIKAFIDVYTEELGDPKELAFGFAPHQVVIYRPSTTVLHDRGRPEVHVVAGRGSSCHSLTTTLAGEVLERDAFTCPS